ncbi:MAG: AAA family ATPase [Lachnospiraceae bacterium]|nr:AAA family ATPase [Lachnospiraceae bacterium]
MYREIINELKKWKEKARRKPLLLSGVRQCGKTYIVEEFAKEYVYLLNDILKMDTVGKMSMNAVESIIGSTTKMSFRDAAEELNRNIKINISHQGAWNVVQKFGEKG